MARLLLTELSRLQSTVSSTRSFQLENRFFRTTYTDDK